MAFLAELVRPRLLQAEEQPLQDSPRIVNSGEGRDKGRGAGAGGKGGHHGDQPWPAQTDLSV